MPTTKIAKMKFETEEEAVASIRDFDAARSLSNEATTVTDRFRDAYTTYYDSRLKDEPTWDGVLRDAEHDTALVRDQQPFGHSFAVRDMPNDLILWLAEHGCLDANNKAIEVFTRGDAPPRELIDINKFKHDKFRVSFGVKALSEIDG